MPKLRILLASTAMAMMCATSSQALIQVPSKLIVKPPVVIKPILDNRPVVTSLRMNAAAAITSNRVVVLDHTLGANAQGVIEYRASEKPDLSDAPWQPYLARPNFNLSIGNGDKIVYFQVRKRALNPNALNGGFDTSAVVNDLITFANPRLIGVTLENGAGFSHDRSIAVAVDYEGNANLYRVSERSDFSDATWLSLGAGRTFNYTVSATPGRKTLYVQVANGGEYISDRLAKSVDFVRTRVHEIPVGLAIATARNRNYTITATSARGEWSCEVYTEPSGHAEFRATPKTFPGYGGADTCTFRLFEGRQLRAPWTVESFAYVGGTLPTSNERVTNTPDTRGGNDLGMTVVWDIPATGLIPQVFHRSFFDPVKLNGPENGNWQDAF